MAQCKATTTTGTPCKMAALRGGKYCYNHSPGAGADRALSRKRGGAMRTTRHFAKPDTLPAKVDTHTDAHALLNYTLAEVGGMDNTHNRARLLLSLFDSFIKSFEIGELEKRIAALEQNKQ